MNTTTAIAARAWQASTPTADGPLAQGNTWSLGFRKAGGNSLREALPFIKYAFSRHTVGRGRSGRHRIDRSSRAETTAENYSGFKMPSFERRISPPERETTNPVNAALSGR
jgi:hypothetical protein